jgi:regulatory protein
VLLQAVRQYFFSRGIGHGFFLLKIIVKTLTYTETITDLVPQRRKKDRVNVHINGEYAFSLAMITAAGLRKGQLISPEEIDRLRTEDNYERAKQSAFNFISYRPRSISELSQNLSRKKFDKNTVERVITRLVELEMLNDKQFARYWVEQRETFKPRSRRALNYELYQKGVKREIVDEVVGEVDEDAAAYRAGRQKAHRWVNLPKDKFRQDMNRFLQRRGFNYNIIAPAMERLWLEVAGDDDHK